MLKNNVIKITFLNIYKLVMNWSEAEVSVYSLSLSQMR